LPGTRGLEATMAWPLDAKYWRNCWRISADVMNAVRPTRVACKYLKDLHFPLIYRFAQTPPKANRDGARRFPMKSQST